VSAGSAIPKFRIEMTRIIEVVERDIPQLSAAIDRLLGDSGG
jgi:hypothetical protein